MQKKWALWLGLFLSMLVPLVAACHAPGSAPAATGPQSPGERVYVLANRGQQIVALAAGGGSSSLVQLPMGLTTLDHQRLFTAVAGSGVTVVTIYQTQDGARLQSFAIKGTYSSNGAGYGNAVLSPDGRWMALRDLAPNVQQTTIAVVDTQTGRVAKLITQTDDFTLDAISPDGQTLYLLQQLNDAEHHYYVRAFDVAANQLNPTIIVDKTDLETQMAGQAVMRQMAADGTVAHTLYVNAAESKAFVHILPVGGGPNMTPFARCIDLPGNGTSALLAHYTLSLAPDETFLYAANAVLGAVVKVSLSGQEVFYDTVALLQKFLPGASIQSPLLYNGSTLSQDGKTLYVVGGDGVWAFDTTTLLVSKHYLAGETFNSVALSLDGKSLYLVDQAKGLLALNLASGQAQQMAQSGLASPLGIAWVSN